MVKESLYDLVQSMTMSEKRHFKIFSSKHVIGQKNDYIGLFDALSKQKTYDEVSLKKAPFVKNLPAEKNYLYHLVLRSLNVFHDSSSPKNQVYGLLKSIEVLYHKGLYPQALKMVNKAKKIAEQNELFVQSLAIGELEIELLSKQFQYSEASKQIEESKRLIQQLENFSTLQKVTTDSYEARLEIGTSRSHEDSKKLKSYLTKDGVGKPNFPLTKRAEMYQLGLNLTHAYFVGDEKLTLDLTEKMTALYEDNPHLISYSTIGYVSSLYNLHNAYVGAKKPNQAEKVLLKLEDCKDKYGIPTSNNIGARVFFYSTNIRLTQYLKKDQYDLAKSLIDSFDKNVDKFTPRIGKPQLYEFYFLRAKYHFVSGEYRKALRFSNMILNDLKFKVRADLLSVVRLLNLLIHYELKNDFTLDYIAKNTFSYLRKKKRLFKVEDELIKFITNHHKANNLKEQIADLKQLEREMRGFKKDQFELSPFSLFDFEMWAKAKIAERSIYSYGK